MAAKRALIHIFLALALLLAQQATFAHAATHLGKPPATDNQQLPQHKVCGQCVVSVQFGNALIGKLLTFDAQRGLAGAVSQPPQVSYSAAPRAFRSRAPPVYL